MNKIVERKASYLRGQKLQMDDKIFDKTGREAVYS